MKIEIKIEHEKRTLPSGRTFIRNRCPICKCYWDTGHQLHQDEKERHDPQCLARRRLVRLLRDKPMTCAEIGNALWATPGQGDLSPARYARAAGSLLAKLKRQHFVYDFYNCDRKKRMWEAA